jgi:hypothetical protein
MGQSSLLSNKKIKHISELTEEELLAQLEEAESTDIGALQQVQIIQTPLLDFIHRFDLKPGKHPVPIRAITLLYRKTTTDRRIKQAVLANRLRMYFRIVDNMVYINKSSFQIQANLEKYLNRKRRIPLTTESFTKNIISFLEHSGIKEGPVPVPCYVIYHIYREYCDRVKRKPVAKSNFFIVGDRLWPKTTTQYGESYLVNNKGDLYHVKKYKEIEKIYSKPPRNRKIFRKRLPKKAKA